MGCGAGHFLVYEYSRDIQRLWGDKAWVALGVTTTTDVGQEIVAYTSSNQLAGAVASVRAAGIQNVGIYDLKGILDSSNPEAWFGLLHVPLLTYPGVPVTGMNVPDGHTGRGRTARID